GVDQSTEIDPTQRVATQDGRSPSPILATTFSDELAISSGGESKIFSVSIKDRGAISLAGHSGKAFWFSKFQSEFVTSDYYYDQYPTWVNDWNQKGVTEKYSSTRWQLSLPAEKYTLQETQQHFKVDLGGFKRTFPHPYGPSSYPYFSTMLTLSPAGDEITADFASSLLEHEALGQGKATDYLAISFSSNDYVIHMYGPASLETEDNLIRLDRTIADLLDNIDQKVGLDNTLIVLSADHGVPEAPATVNQLGSPQAQYFQQDTLISSDLLTRMDKEFGLNKDAIRLYAHPYIYLNHTVIKDKGVELEKLQNMMAEELMKVKGIAYAVTSTSIEKNRVPDTQIMTMVKNNYHPKRSGDIYIIYEPRSYINDMEGLTIASMHGSPWRYDTHVPIIFSGYSINSKNISREVTPYAIAPTLSNILGITQPSGSIGEVLPEVTN
ncbi:alkaline phosphatase, partial [Vibrio sp. 10N.286.49.B3]|uniref:alkaline phosphatase family protein n=1 Tax=Vibrio sp. 10N.286.49.B3 TaxID=1880855 RepID=UPI000C840281